MSIRVVAGEIDAMDATTRAVIPTAMQGRWPPFERVAETIATPRRRFPVHRHEGVEVLTYVIEGSGSYEFESRAPDLVATGSTQLLTAPAAVSHVINPGKGQTIRWLAVIAALPAGKATEPRLQSSGGVESGVQPDGTIVRAVVGPGTKIQSAVGLKAESIQFVEEGTSFRKIGHDAIAVCYAMGGTGRIDNLPLEGGEAALVDESSGVAIQGDIGFRLVLLRVPRGP